MTALTELNYPAMRAPLDAARHLPAHYYTSADILEEEYEKIFLRDWLYVAREEELSNPGDFIAMTIARQPLLLCRDRAGKLQVLFNVCRHRGTCVASGNGNTRVFSCPYHAWTYNLNGTLRGAPFTDNIENFSKADWSLRPVNYVVWAGFIFVNFSTEPRDFATFIGNCPEVYAPYRFERQKLGLKFTLEYACNWKFAVENLVDTYHAAALHSGTFGQHQPLDTYKFERFEGGYHSRFSGGTLTPDGKTLLGAFPWLPEEYHGIGYSSHLPPNFAFFPRLDHTSYITSWPGTSPEESRCHVHFLFAPEALALPDFEERLKIYIDFYKAALEEDESMVMSLQVGMHSNGFVPGPLSHFEVGVHSVANYYLDRMTSS